MLSCLCPVALWSPGGIGLPLGSPVHVYLTFCCVFVAFPYGALGQLWYLIVSIPDLCLLPYFKRKHHRRMAENGFAPP